MYNHEIYEQIQKKFGKTNAKLYAIMENYKYELLARECKHTCNEVFFEKQWWEELVNKNKTAIYGH
jgi:hypothetical protein